MNLHAFILDVLGHTQNGRENHEKENVHLHGRKGTHYFLFCCAERTSFNEHYIFFLFKFKAPNWLFLVKIAYKSHIMLLKTAVCCRKMITFALIERE